MRCCKRKALEFLFFALEHRKNEKGVGEMLANKDAVIFDLDGTLVDSMWMWRSIDIEYLGKFGIALPENLQAAIEGMSFSETACYFKERFQIPDSLEVMKAEWNQMAYEKYKKEVSLKEGVLEFLIYLKENHIKTGIATSNSIELVKTVLQAHNLINYFDSIHTSCEVSKGKPAPDVYLLVAKELGVEPKKCLVFEDIAQGIMAGKNAGMTTCAVWDVYSQADTERKKELADYYIESYFEVLEQSKACFFAV